MIKIAKRLQMLYIIICMILCISVLTGCQSHKYEVIELPGEETEVLSESEETQEVSAERTDDLQQEPAQIPSAVSSEMEAAASGVRASSDISERGLSKAESFTDGSEASEPETSQEMIQEETVPFNGKIVAIDPGHQAKGNSDKEPIGPGSSTMKTKVASGATGIATGLEEYQLTLAVSKKLKKELESRGYQVVMIRESNDVNLSNAERAQIANESGASVFVRIHGNSLDNSSVTGVLTMCQTAGNPYNGNLHDASYSLSKKITDNICAVTGARNRGVQETDSMSGINWCQIPVSIVEMGFMSNPEEDRNMADETYQGKLVQGIAEGIDAYFGF